MSTPEPTKKERRDAARAERQQAEQAEAAKAERKRRLTMLGAVLGSAAVVVVAAVLISSGGSKTKSHVPKAGQALSGTSDVAAMLNGIPQSGITLGNPKAPVSVIEFADLQCPVCQEYSLQVLPHIVQDYVRTGKAKIDLRLVTILDRSGPGDSARMARVAYGAQLQNKLWNFADTIYFNQGEEETNYATDAYIRRIAAGVPGLDVTKAFATRASSAATAQLGAATSLFSRYGATGTPTIVVGKTGGDLKTLSGFDQSTVSKAIDAALK